MTKKRIAVLGSTGSIGRNTLKVIEDHAGRFEVAALTAFNNTVVMEAQIRQFKPRYVAMAADNIQRLARKYPDVKFYDARRDIPEIVSLKDVDVVVIAVTGAAGLAPFLAAARAGKVIAPANKEALVMAGDIIMHEVRRHGAAVIPVDSEQSAIFQCLEGRAIKDVRCIHLTASGGPLRDVPRNRHDRYKIKDILAHPRWDMGVKITVDSATMMNKGFEVIEAQRLFGVGVRQISVLVHPEAVVHSMVELNDGAVLAQLGVTDMRLPIQYAMTYPERWPTGTKRLDLASLGQLTFAKPDLDRFPSLALAYEAARLAGTIPAVLNAANEVAVDAFLRERISFTGMHTIVEKVVLKQRNIRKPGLEDIEQADTAGRVRAAEYIERLT
ncbi:MAG: 1-deoxy-D-xylulose-5-phosphate reductoisomerase [Candidatus Omnitrophota bacterium]